MCTLHRKVKHQSLTANLEYYEIRYNVHANKITFDVVRVNQKPLPAGCDFDGQGTSSVDIL